MKRIAIFALALVWLLAAPSSVYARGGGGCFPAGVLISTPNGQIPIEQIKACDIVTAVARNGRIVSAKVQATHRTQDYVISIRAGSQLLRTTAEHPICLSGGGFCAAGELNPGDSVLLCSENKIVSAKIENRASVTIAEQEEVYNLTVDGPHTFIADGFVVHNKGGGGCFPAGVLIRTLDGEIPIEKIRPGDTVTAITRNGRMASAKVEATHKTRDYVISIRAGSQCLRTTAEHPICLSGGGFCAAGELNLGDNVLLYSERKMVPAGVENQPFATSAEQEEVYNLTVGRPHTFIADGFVVHNKGGGGGGGGFGGGFGGGGYHGSGSGGNGEDGLWGFIFIFGVIVVYLVIKGIASRDTEGGENLDFVYGRSVIEKKSGKTLKLLEFLSKQDQTVLPESLRKQVEATFLKLQECWQARDYGPMQAYDA